jgi:NAD dependent epimerase/dehydratase family enzyme
MDSTSTVAVAIAGLPAPTVQVLRLLGDRLVRTGDRTVEEDSPPARLLSTSARQEAAQASRDAGRGWSCVPGCAARDGGMLKPQLLPMKLGISGKLGGGRQWWPWMSMEDWLRALFLLARARRRAGEHGRAGASTNAEFTRELARQLHRPAIMPIPAVALKVVLGGFSHEVLTSERVLPGVLNKAGYSFRHPDLPSALHAALNE